MIEKDFYILLHLARRMQLNGTLETSTGSLAKELNISQQTVSRKLQEFHKKGIVGKTITPVGVTITITEKGKEQLRKIYGDLLHLFGQQLLLHGIVKDGFGEGRFYMSQEQYKKQFQSILSFAPYQGTLNLAVDKSNAELFLTTKKQFYVTGFQTKERTFGGLKCYPVLIAKKISGAIIIPDRTAHTLDTVEVIAPNYLRDELHLENRMDIIIT